MKIKFQLDPKNTKLYVESKNKPIVPNFYDTTENIENDYKDTIVEFDIEKFVVIYSGRDKDGSLVNYKVTLPATNKIELKNITSGYAVVGFFFFVKDSNIVLFHLPTAYVIGNKLESGFFINSDFDPEFYFTEDAEYEHKEVGKTIYILDLIYVMYLSSLNKNTSKHLVMVETKPKTKI